MNNRFLLMRHGRSLANQEAIIISSLDEGVRGWGLAVGAEIEIKESLKGLKLPVDTLIFSSPFKRAFETARRAADEIGCGKVVITEALRERFFGKYDKTSDEHYHRVWQDDAENSDIRQSGVESTGDVLKRLLEFIKITDSEQSGRTIILVSHGDPLNILLAHSSGMPVKMKTSEIRPLFL